MEQHSKKGNNENEKEKEKELKKVMQKILPDVKPTEEEMAIATNQANEIVKRLIKIVPKETEIRIVGSLMRGTNVRGASDIDVFLLFDKKKSNETIIKEGLFYAKQLASGERDRVEIKYAEHPYARVYIDDLGAEADIVPAYKIENIEEMATAVDRSPMHAEFLNKVLSMATHLCLFLKISQVYYNIGFYYHKAPIPLFFLVLQNFHNLIYNLKFHTSDLQIRM